MDINKTIENLRKNEFTVSYFETKKEAAAHIDSQIDGKTVGFGDSQTLQAMGLHELLEAHNTVYDAGRVETDEELVKVGKQALIADVFLLSVNGIAETGQMVNIDGTGNRTAGSLFGHEKVYFVAGVNKICPTLEDAKYRARNVAAPLDAIRFDCKTPCSVKKDKCYDCRSPRRICNAEVVYMMKMNNIDEVEVVLINEELGY